MRNFKVKVDDAKGEFFKELLQNLDFVSFEEVDSFREPRVYPAAEFEIRSPKDTTSTTYKKSTSGKGKAAKGKESTSSEAQSRQDSFNDIREVMQKIDALRNHSKK